MTTLTEILSRLNKQGEIALQCESYHVSIDLNGLRNISVSSTLTGKYRLTIYDAMNMTREQWEKKIINIVKGAIKKGIKSIS